MDKTFEFLFKYPPSVFEAGELVLGSGLGRTALLIWAAGAIALAGLAYRGVQIANLATRRALVALRAAVFFCVGLALLQPTIRVKAVAEQQTFVGILIDDSKSLAIEDDGGKRRGDFARTEFANPTSATRTALDRRFKTRVFRFSNRLDRLTDGDAELSFSGTRTDLAQALNVAQQELGTTPLSGLVLVSDGGDNVNGPLNETLLSLRAQGIPVFTVGLGQERFERDLEIVRVETPTSVLQGSSVVATVTFRARGQGRAPLQLIVEDDGRILSSQAVIANSPESSTVRVTVRADEPGSRLLRFRLTELPGEVVRDNNRFDTAIDVVGGRQKILYFEGSARHEAKFIRRAVRDDKNLQVATLERTANEKFLRLDVESGDELVTGFPKTRQELFAYRGLVIGGVEASFFSLDQLRMMADFVSLRGGGLLMLGSDQSFAEGGYAGTAVAEALPVILEGGQNSPRDSRFTALKVAVTALGATQPATQLAGNEEESARRFDSLPPLSTTHILTRVKPGALTLLAGQAKNGPADRIVLAQQRFGRGRSLAFGVLDSWRWQMHSSVAPDDLSHEVFWRQLLRTLVAGSTGPVSVALSSAIAPPQSVVTIRADVADATFSRVNDARVNAVIRAPDGSVQDMPLRWTIDKDGEYQGDFRPESSGVYQVRVSATRGDKVLGEDVAHVRVEEISFEAQNAEMKADTLKRIASETRGRFYTRANVASLPDDLRYSPRTATVVEEKDLWDSKGLFLFVLLSLFAEWGLRKANGLV